MRNKNRGLNHFSVVIIAKNEEHVLERTLASLRGVTDDLVIVDSGSTDKTLDIARKYGARILQTEWRGYGATKNAGNAIAKYDWILSLDADEAIDDTLRQSLPDPSLYNDPAVVYDLDFKMFLGEKHIRHGQWLNTHNIKLFNRQKVSWNSFLVHEKLEIPPEYKVRKLKGYVLHYTVVNLNDYIIKLNRYALLSGEKYFKQGKKNTWYKLYLTPPFTFLLNYIVRLGFLDGWHGFVLAKLSAYYAFLKYAYLKEIMYNTGNRQ